MTTVLAVPRLFDLVVARFAADAAAAVPPTEPPAQSFGWREPPKKNASGPRIVWVPGDDSSGDAGPILPARQVNRNPRPLATLAELVTVYIEASDLAAPEDERAQYQVVRELHDAWLRAVHLAARGSYEIRSQRWVIDKNVRRHGAALRVLLAVEAMVPDAPYTAAPPPLSAEIDVHELDHSEPLTAP